MATRATSHPSQLRPAVAGAVLSTVATIVQMAVVLWMVSPATLKAMALPLSAAAITATIYGLLFTVRAWRGSRRAADETGRAFDPRGAALLAAFMSLVLVLAAALREWNDSTGVIVAASVAGLVDTHSAAVSVASLVAAGRLLAAEAAVPILLALSANTLSKIGAAVTAGDKRFAAQVIPGLVIVIAAAWAAHALTGVKAS
jgi:uncharacterized membrane protein (DUF4010 family)